MCEAPTHLAQVGGDRRDDARRDPVVAGAALQLVQEQPADGDGPERVALVQPRDHRAGLRHLAPDGSRETHG